MTQLGAIGSLSFGYLFATSLMDVKSHSVHLCNVYKVFIGWLVVVTIVMLLHNSFGTQLLVYSSILYFFLLYGQLYLSGKKKVVLLLL